MKLTRQMRQSQRLRKLIASHEQQLLQLKHRLSHWRGRVPSGDTTLEQIQERVATFERKVSQKEATLARLRNQV